MSYFRNQIFDKSAFGELGISESRAFIQAAPTYNLIPANFRVYTTLSGTASAENRMFKVSTGVSSGGYAAIQSFRALNYKPGEGGLARFTGRFVTNVANSWQGVGLLSIGDELSFGYNGTVFGIWHRYGGYSEVRTITVTAGSSGSTNLTLTLNGVAYTIPLTAGTTSHNAYEIAVWLNNDANQTIWKADSLENTVIINALSDGPKAGTYSFSHASATGSIALNTSGVTKTSIHIPQSNWNVNTYPTLNPSNGNVYQIKYQYLGFGNIKFYIENSDTGDFDLVHMIKYANNNTEPSLTNPSLRIGLYCVSLGSTTNLTIYSGSVAGFVQGHEAKTRNPRAARFSQTIDTSVFTNILTLKNRRTYNGFTNQVEIEPLSVTISNEGTKNAIIELRANPTIVGDLIFEPAGTNLVGDVSTSVVTVSSGTLIQAFSVAGGQTINISLEGLNIRIPPSLMISVSAKLNSGSSSLVSATVSWYEDL